MKKGKNRKDGLGRPASSGGGARAQTQDWELKTGVRLAVERRRLIAVRNLHS